MKRAENLINNCMYFAFKQVDEQFVYHVFTPDKSKSNDDLFLTAFNGNDRVDDQVKLTLIANLLEAATTFFEKD